MSVKNFYFILVKPQLGENIGASARVLKNFGFNKLRIVNPIAKWPNFKAKATSVGAIDILSKAKLFSSISDAVQDLHVVVGTTARLRNKNKKYLSFKNFKKINKNLKVGILFGPESSGLSNKDLSNCNFVTKIPTNKKFESINLSHAVSLFCFKIFEINVYLNNNNYEKYPVNKAKKNEVEDLTNFLIKSLDSKGFLQPGHKRDDMLINIRNIFHRLELSDKEIRIFKGIFANLTN